MNDNVSDTFKLGVELSMTALIIWSMMILISVVQDLGVALTDTNVITDRLSEYRQYNQFDGRDVYGQDIVSLIYQSRGLPFVYVENSNPPSGNNKIYTQSIWDMSTPTHMTSATDMKSLPEDTGKVWLANTITSHVDLTKTYTSTIIYGINDEVIGFKFVAK